MQQEQIHLLNRSREAVDLVRRNYESQLNQYKAIVTKLENQCDHKFPDGRSAMNNGFMFDTCQICHTNNG